MKAVAQLEFNCLRASSFTNNADSKELPLPVIQAQSEFSRSVVSLLLKSQNLFFQSTTGTTGNFGILKNTTHGTQIGKTFKANDLLL